MFFSSDPITKTCKVFYHFFLFHFFNITYENLRNRIVIIEFLWKNLTSDLANDSLYDRKMSNGTTTVPTATPCCIKAPLVVTIVGSPCRGKSLAAHKISRNLFWKGEDVKGKLI